jgi:hypothetical protein
MSFALGYRKDCENYASLVRTGRLPVIEGAFTAPHSISHRGWRKAKNQGQVGSCSGFSKSSGGEVLNYIATGGQIQHFSDMHSYITNQMCCGLLGSDQGATIDGARKAAEKYGFARDELFPYPGRYMTDIPEAATAEGVKHLVKNHAVLGKYDDLYQWIASGVGVVILGVPWIAGMTQVGKTMELSDLRGHMLGGHALVMHGVNGDVTDGDGRPYIDMENSHSEAWGDSGFTLVSPKVIDRWFQQQETLIGITDLEAFAPRKIASYAEWGG